MGESDSASMGMNACASEHSHKVSMEASPSIGPSQLFFDLVPKSYLSNNLFKKLRNEIVVENI